MTDIETTTGKPGMMTIEISTLQEHTFQWEIPKNLENGAYRTVSLFFHGISLEIIYVNIGGHKFIVRFPLLVPKEKRYNCTKFTYLVSHYPPEIVNQGTEDGELRWKWKIYPEDLGNPVTCSNIINGGLGKICHYLPTLLQMVVGNLSVEEAKSIHDQRINLSQIVNA